MIVKNPQPVDEVYEIAGKVSSIRDLSIRPVIGSVRVMPDNVNVTILLTTCAFYRSSARAPMEQSALPPIETPARREPSSRSPDPRSRTGSDSRRR